MNNKPFRILGIEHVGVAIKNRQNLNSIFSDSNIEVLGPVEAPLFLLRGKYRYRLLLKGNNRKKLNFFTKNIIKKCPPPSNIRITIDVDPYTFT